MKTNFIKGFRISISFMMATILLFSCSKEETPKVSSTDNIEKRQYVLGNFQPITACEAGNLKYYIEDCFDGTDYEEAIPAGMELFNDSPTPLFFTEVDNIEYADLVFTCNEIGEICGAGNASFPQPNHPGDSPPNTQTFFPSGGSIGAEVRLSTGWKTCPCTDDELDLCFFMHTVVHEVVHTLGLYHNDIGSLPNPSPIYNPVHVECTPTGPYDEGSIINSGWYEDQQGNWCDASCEFNDNDILALQYLYPFEELIGPDVICLNESAFYCVPKCHEKSKLQISWDIDWSEVIGYSQLGYPDCLKLTFNSPGEHTISTDVSLSNGKSYTLEKTILVIPDECELPEMPMLEGLLCYDEVACFEYSEFTCIESITADLSELEGVIEVYNFENTFCIYTLTEDQRTIDLEVEVHSFCNEEPYLATWSFEINNPKHCK